MMAPRFLILCYGLWAVGGFLQAQTARQTTEAYIEQFSQVAMQEMRTYRIPASITLGQGILESASGNSRLAKECNNHFGIKCRKDWTGPSCTENDDAENECFRAYGSAMDSYRDHSLFLVNGQRYASLFQHNILDFEAWAHGLRAAGYATNPAYGTILSGIIRRYRLGRFDTLVILGFDPAGQTAAKPGMTNGIPATIAGWGETPEDVAKKNGLGYWQIYRYNDLKRGDSLMQGEIVYLKPKRRTGSAPTHTYIQGEDFRLISQQYGIKLKQLYKLNRIKPGQPIAPGEVLNLQEKRETAPKAPTGGNAPAPVRNTPLPPAPPVRNTPVPPASGTSARTHTVAAGETLYGISRQYGVSVEAIRQENQLGEAPISVGQVLKIPAVAGAKPEQSKTPLYHDVQPGETAYSIVKKYGISLDDLKRWNNLPDFVMRTGMRLRVSE